MSNRTISRRDFLARSGGAFGMAWLGANFPAISAAAAEANRVAGGDDPETYHFFSKTDALLIDAIGSQIVPSAGEGPGAHEARVAVFIDRAMSGFMQGQAERFSKGLGAFKKAFADAYPGGDSFADAGADTRDEFFATQVDSRFFGIVRFLTHLGMCSLPSYGGNFQKMGWALVGFEDRHSFQSPFGYYDKDYPGFAAVAAKYSKEG
jgi:gluconate 2-dehydrogenase gamma chain